MSEEQAKRKLAAILSADAKDYSRLMEEDEEATVRTITAYRELMVSQIQNQNGRVVDAKGDNLLAEFSSVVDAVRCAVEIQKELGKRNEELPEHRKMEFRIGVNLGDVIEEGETIYGDGVNIAARLETLAEGGGICISGTAYDHVENKLGLDFEYLGEQAVKNIRKPVRLYRIGKESVDSDVEMEKELPLPENPSIAVLPFVNMSGDPEQEYFSDGISEDIITALSRIPDMFVIARNSTFTYKGKPVNVRQMGRELGVRYVLEGSVRKAGKQVRITAQLIDATTGHHLWAERYDRYLEDVFAIQDEITWKILKALELKLTGREQTRLYARGTENIDAYLKIWEARSHLERFDKGSNLLSRQLCEEVIALEPKWDLPYCTLGWTHCLDVGFRWSDSPEESVQKAFQLAQKALSLNESPIAHALLANIYTMAKQHDKAKEESEKSIALDPNSADAHAWYAYALIYAGEPLKAISLFETAMRLNPFPPSWYFGTLGTAYRLLGHNEDAIKAYKRALYKEPTNLFVHLGLTVAYANSGLKEEAQAQAQEVLRIDPSFSLEYLAKILPFKDHKVTERTVDALRKAGLK
jgi:adenylate cyclase